MQHAKEQNVCQSFFYNMVTYTHADKKALKIKSH